MLLTYFSHFGKDGKLASFPVATTEKFKKDGEWIEKTTWHDVACFGYVAERAAKICKGDHVFIEGRMESHTYDDKEGVKRWAWQLMASKVEIMEAAEDRKKKGDAVVTGGGSDGEEVDNLAF